MELEVRAAPSAPHRSSAGAAISPRRLDAPDDDVDGVRVRVHPSLCDGWGNCHRWGPNVFPLDDEGRVDVHLLEVPPELAREARRAAASCPNGAITIIEHPQPMRDAGQHGAPPV